MQIIFASHNIKKSVEIRKLLPATFQLLNLNDINIHQDIPETGSTFSDNALQKALYVYERTGKNCFADDSGLEVEALNMQPGVYSARYAGESKNDEANINLLLKELEGKENRKARFTAVMALIINGEQYFFEGIVRGKILNERKGNGGFGYDPVFIADGFSKSFAEIILEEKNLVSHRATALKKMIEFLNKNYSEM